jgi:hypothetical protein
MEFKLLAMFSNNVWTPELIKYAFYIVLVIFIGQYLLNLLAEINIDLLNISHFCKEILKINKYFSGIILFISILIKIILIYFIFEKKIEINKNIYSFIMINEIILFFILGVINFEIFWFKVMRIIFKRL